ncbi:MAG: HAD-IIIA family hydrolase [Flavobacteriales bacterium]|nr:HAD-IIIA family hydrolase [Flavobacteriales bacterium]
MESNNYKALLKSVHTFCFDIDGVFTDNIVYLTSDGEQARTANVRDGYAVQLAIRNNIDIVIISGGRSEAVRKRFEGLGVKHIHLGVKEKLPLLRQYLADNLIKVDDVCYMGDDIPDLACMKYVGLPVCPADAVPEIKEAAAYISPYGGGKGCVRDVLEQAMKLKGIWMNDTAHIW